MVVLFLLKLELLFKISAMSYWESHSAMKLPRFNVTVTTSWRAVWNSPESSATVNQQFSRTLLSFFYISLSFTTVSCASHFFSYREHPIKKKSANIVSNHHHSLHYLHKVNKVGDEFQQLYSFGLREILLLNAPHSWRESQIPSHILNCSCCVSSVMAGCVWTYTTLLPNMTALRTKLHHTTHEIGSHFPGDQSTWATIVTNFIRFPVFIMMYPWITPKSYTFI